MTGIARAIEPTLRRFLAPALVLLLGVAVSVGLFFYVRDDIERDAQLRFERQAADAKHIIERRLHSYAGVTYGLKALFAARDTISRAEFHQYVASLNLEQNYPGFVQLNYARHIRGTEKRRLEDEVRRDTSLDPRGYPQFAVKPPGERREHHVLIYIDPMEGNSFAFGIDITASAPQARVVDQYSQTGALFSSGRLLNVGKDGSVGLAMRLAVYRNGAPLDTAEQRRAALIGTVGAGYNVRKLMAGVLDDTTMTSMRYRLYDAGPMGQRQAGVASLLYDSAQTAAGAPREDFVLAGEGSSFEAVLPIELASRRWELRFSTPRTALVQGLDSQLPWIVLVGALICSVLLFAVVHGFASSRERAMKLAGEITRELRESEADLAHAQALAQLGSWTLDLKTGQMAWSAETRRLLELEQGGAPPRLGAFLSPLLREDREAFRAAAARCVETGIPARLEFGLRLSGTGTRWAHFILQPMDGDRGMLRGTIMDVTERKRALEMQRENAAQIRDLLRRLVYAQETERRRFSADLHDLVGQSLSVLGMGIETIRSLLPGRLPQKADQTFTQMGGLLKETMGAVREVMSDLRPPLLDDYGLYAALDWHARQMEGRTGLRVQFGGEKLEPRPPAEVEVALFRIAQEALINVAKHAGASQAQISLSRDSDRVRLVVEDDGCGIGVAANDSETVGWGMAVMRERAAAVGGAMHVESPGRGTRIVVEVAT
ncbi:MAG TPA: CHASE domain-containing protein [Burkholderiales bacterium]|nr:CHASE domain-containing protein [Burkholderiales bacterium]